MGNVGAAGRVAEHVLLLATPLDDGVRMNLQEQYREAVLEIDSYWRFFNCKRSANTCSANLLVMSGSILWKSVISSMTSPV